MFVGKQVLFSIIAGQVKTIRNDEHNSALEYLREAGDRARFKADFQSFCSSQDQGKLAKLREKYKAKGLRLEQAYLDKDEWDR